MTDPHSQKERRWILKIGLAAVSTLLTYGLIVSVARLGAWRAGIHDREFRYENAIDMWRADPTVGFRNKQGFSAYCFGTVQVTTNEQGFRGEQPVSQAKPTESLRIVGVGDSVMWGTCVDAPDSFLGQLQAKLQSRGRNVEVINAGVVGYSTLQEYLLLKHSLLNFSPDVVIVNFCENDLLPTEDPFNLVRGVYLDHMSRCIDDPDSGLTVEDQAAMNELARIFQSPMPVHDSFAQSSNECKRLAIKLFLELPVRRMAELAKANDAQLVYLLIPPRDDEFGFLLLSEFVKRVLDESKTAYLDLKPVLKLESSGSTAGVSLDSATAGWPQLFLESLLPDVRSLNLLRQIEQVHSEQNYIDFIHPSRTGNALIAEELANFLE